MNAELFTDAMSQISDKYIVETLNYPCKSKRRPTIIWFKRSAAVACLAIVLCFGTVMTVSVEARAAVSGWVIQSINDWFGAELITPENKDLIGKEVIDNIKPEVSLGEGFATSGKHENIIEASNVIDSVSADSIVLPDSVSEFKVTNNIIPEIIMTNGSMAIFYQNDYEGWSCKVGDTLSFSFEKYVSEVTPNQTIVVGYICDGVLYDGIAYKNLEDKFEFTITEAGEYNIYVISATSDYLALKQGVIEINK